MPVTHSTRQLQRFAEECLETRVVLREVSWPHAEARVWAVQSGADELAFLKQHRRRQKFAAELNAYREYVPVLGKHAPRLIGVFTGEQPALLLEALPGRVVGSATWPESIEYQLHVRAAGLLRKLHDLPIGRAARLSVERRTRDSLDSWVKRAERYFPVEVIDWVIEQVDAGLAEAPPACVCHRDFSPRNWVATDSGELALIDFERASVDYQCLDWSRLWMREWRRRPVLQDAFFEGYGTVTGRWQRPLVRLMAMYAVAGVIWASEHRDSAFAEENRQLLERLRRGPAAP